MHCRAQAVQLRRDRQRFQRAKVQVIMIGLGEPERARQFRAEFDLPFTVLADPSRASYQAYGLVYRLNVLREVTSPDSVIKTLSRLPRYGVAATDQDMLQLGGVFGVDSSGTIRFIHRSLRTADQPTTAMILAAMTET